MEEHQSTDTQSAAKTKDVEKFVTRWMKEHIDVEDYPYHQLGHTKAVVGVATLLAEAYDLSSADVETIQVAAWFHDTGYAQGGDGHEERSAQMAKDYLRQHGWSSERIDQVEQLIMVTKMGATPQGLHQQIIKDADCHHVGTKEYFQLSARLRDEWDKVGMTYDQKEWYALNLQFFQKHTFHTAVAGSEFGNRKRKNLVKIMKRMDDYAAYEEATDQLAINEDTGEVMRPDGTKADRGVETMYRVTLRNHNQLSKIADNKSNIMLSINSIMLSILLSTLASKLDTNPHLILPTIVLTITCVTSVIIAVLATRPNLSSAEYSDEAFLDNRFNMLFFGNFYKLSLQKFEWGVRTLMNNERLLYGNLAKDLYFLGLVLAKKYRLLKLCYTIFMIGIVLSSLAFVIAFITYQPDVAPMLPELDE